VGAFKRLPLTVIAAEIQRTRGSLRIRIVSWGLARQRFAEGSTIAPRIGFGAADAAAGSAATSTPHSEEINSAYGFRIASSNLERQGV
jgi:hypothetical protein